MGATPTGSISSRAGAARLSGTRRFESVPGRATHDRDETPRGCGPEHAGYRIPQRDRCGFESRPGPGGPGSSTAEQLPVCITTTAASTRCKQTACGPEWSGYQGERPAWPGGRGFESRLRSSEHAHRPAHPRPQARHDREEERMSYLIQYLPRACAPVRKLRGARVDEQILLNQPGYHAGAYVHVFVEDTSRRRIRRDGYPSPRFRTRDRGLHEPRSASSSTSRRRAIARTRCTRSRRSSARSSDSRPACRRRPSSRAEREGARTPAAV